MLDIDFLFEDFTSGENFIVNILCNTKASCIDELSQAELKDYIQQAKDIALRSFENPVYECVLTPFEADSLGYDTY